MSKLRIGFVFDDGLDAPDGVQQYILTLGRWLTAQGHDVHYLVGQTERTDIPNTHVLSNNASVSFNGNKLSVPLLGSMSSIRKVLEENDFDVLHVQMPYSPQMAGRVISAANSKVAIIGTFHILPYGKIQSLGVKVLGKILSSTLKRFDSIVAVSGAAQEFASEQMSISSDVVPNAVPLSNFTQGKKIKKYDDGKLNIVFLGRLVERKGCMQFLQAIQRLHDQGKLDDVRVIIAGKGAELSKLERYVADYRMQEVVDFAGWITEEEKPDYLKTADIAVMPSIAGESFGIVLVEAIASGAGVIVGGDNPGYRYVLDNDPLALVDPLDTSAFADRLARLISDKALRESINKAQRKRILDFDVEIVGKEILGKYREAISKRS